MGSWLKSLLNAHDQFIIDREMVMDELDRPLRTEAEFMAAKKRHREKMMKEKRREGLE